MKDQKKSESIEAKVTEKKVAAAPKESKEKKTGSRPKKGKSSGSCRVIKKI